MAQDTLSQLDTSSAAPRVSSQRAFLGREIQDSEQLPV